jgi:hypothetical protein
MVSRAVFEPAAGARAYVDPLCSCPAVGALKVTFVPGDNAPANNHTVLLSAGCAADSSAPSSAPSDESTLSPCRSDPIEVTRFLRQCTALTLGGDPYPATHLQASTEELGAFLLTAPGWTQRPDRLEIPQTQDFQLEFC